jgi:hypothetical protein
MASKEWSWQKICAGSQWSIFPVFQATEFQVLHFHAVQEQQLCIGQF